MEEYIDCSVYCPFLVRQLNSCPKREINFNDYPLSENLFEIFMVLLSFTPYFLSFVHFINTAYYKTSRSAMVLIMLYSQSIAIKIIKDIYMEPRPNFKCNHQYGNPSNHSTFFASLIMWTILELIYLDERYRYNNIVAKGALYIFSPLVFYSRFYLKYHSIRQVN